MNISIKFPFKETTEGGVFRGNKTTLEKIQSNLIALLTLKKRQRPMDNDLYSPLFDYIFEPWDEISEENCRKDLINKIKKYIPEVQILKIIFAFEDTQENMVEVKIVYSVPELGSIEDIIIMSVPTNNISV